MNKKARTPPPPPKPTKSHPWRYQSGAKPNDQRTIAYRDRMGIRA